MIVGIDPGLQSTAIVALDGDRVHYAANIKTPATDTDEMRCSYIADHVSLALEKVPETKSVWVEDYEYQGKRTEGPNAIRLSRLVGYVAQSARGIVACSYLVTRNTWGRRLGIRSDDGLKQRLSQLTGLALKNAHLRDAAAVALYGQSMTRQMGQLGSYGK